MYTACEVQGQPLYSTPGAKKFRDQDVTGPSNILIISSNALHTRLQVTSQSWFKNNTVRLTNLSNLAIAQPNWNKVNFCK